MFAQLGPDLSCDDERPLKIRFDNQNEHPILSPKGVDCHVCWSFFGKMAMAVVGFGRFRREGRLDRIMSPNGRN